MLVKMNNISSRERRISGSNKSTEGMNRYSDDVESLNSWSEITAGGSSGPGSTSSNLSTSFFTSNPGSRLNSTSSGREVQGRYGNIQPLPLLNNTVEHLSKSQLQKADKNYEVEDELSSPTIFELDSGPDSAFFQGEPIGVNKYGYDQTDSSSYQARLSALNKIKDSDNKTGINKSKFIHSKAQDKRIEKIQDFQKETSSSKNAENSSQIKNNYEKLHSTKSHPRPKFFDFQKGSTSHLHQTKRVQDHNTDLNDGNSESFSSLPSNFSQKSFEIAPNLCTQYNPNKVERVSHLGKEVSKSKERLFNSQPVLSQSPPTQKQTMSSCDSLEHQIEQETIIMKAQSVWYSFRWNFKPKQSMKYDSPLFMLGKCYHRRKDDPSTEPEEGHFLKDFASRIWLTYRRHFYPIPGTSLNTDLGWGCMLRSGQMLIAQCLVTHYLTRDWRLYDSQTETQTTFYREIIRWFSDPIDTPSDKTPFCLHHLAKYGRNHHKIPGEWYGPTSVAYIFRDAFTHASQSLPILSQLCIYVAQDCTVYIKDVINLCTSKQRSESITSLSDSTQAEVNGDTFSELQGSNDTWLRSLIILIPMRLGGEVMNEIYAPCVKGLLSQNNCMGIIGGKPKHSLYFLGWQEDKLIYLDPHLCRDAVDINDKNFSIETYHCLSPRKLTINKMDPSCTVGFYIRNAQEFKKFVQEVKEYISPPKQRGTYPLFIFSEGSHHDASGQDNISTDKGRVRVTHYHLDENGQRKRTFSKDSEEYVML